MDLMTAVSSINKLREFVEQSLYESLAAIELDAAVEALAKAKLASDPRSQLWSVIGHLETAEAATAQLSGLKNFAKFLVNSNGPKEHHDRRTYLLIIMAIVYRALDEEKLMNRSLDKMRPLAHIEESIPVLKKNPLLGLGLGMVFGVIAPIGVAVTAAKQGYRGLTGTKEIPSFSPEQLEEIKSSLRNMH